MTEMNNPDMLLKKRVNKKVFFRFCGKDLSFYLSMGLFSSFDIDSGTRFLLRTFVQVIDFNKVHHLLDAGCGTGVIAISLKKAFPHITIDALDRDCLALEMTVENARLNNTKISIFPGLDTLSVQPDFRDPFRDSHVFSINRKKYDIITTNIPAKAGLPVLRRFFRNGLASLSDCGYFAVVIVASLRKTVENLLAEMDAQTIHENHTNNHSVFIIQRIMNNGMTPIVPDVAFPGPYLRNNEYQFSGRNISYTLTTVFNLPGFDTIPLSAAVSIDLYTKTDPIQQSFLFWNPGQGHSTVMILKDRFSRGKKVLKNCHCVLSGRDLLALLISRFNIQQEFPELSCRILHTPGIDYLSENINNLEGDSFDFIGIEPDIIPGCSFAEILTKSILEIISPFGKMLISGKSSDIGRIVNANDSSASSLTLTHSKKTKGFRAVIFSYKL
ncbi:MAG: methyltransferase [Spirochaetales bacterium]|nr:methyltransferase [Spirochaetales bacterium]